jgi:methionyl aminopeptidase
MTEALSVDARPTPWMDLPVSRARLIKTPEQIELMRRAGRHVAEVLLELRKHVKPGVTAWELDHRARKMIEKLDRAAMKEIPQRRVVSSFLDYAPGGLPPFRGVTCVSVNREIVHGIPGKKKTLKDGDVVSIDFGLSYGGMHGDSAVTIGVGRLEPGAQRLIDVTREALERGIEQMHPGRQIGDIGHAVQEQAESAGFSVVKQFVGHGIGEQMHEPPQVANYGKPRTGERLKAGMVLAIEPMITMGSDAVEFLSDQWTAVTADGSLAAHFEHTILITDHGPEVLTRAPGSH